eukprot:12002532-Alexandrium_andersonii.AAC.1
MNAASIAETITRVFASVELHDLLSRRRHFVRSSMSSDESGNGDGHGLVSSKPTRQISATVLTGPDDASVMTNVHKPETLLVFLLTYAWRVAACAMSDTNNDFCVRAETSDIVCSCPRTRAIDTVTRRFPLTVSYVASTLPASFFGRLSISAA